MLIDNQHGFRPGFSCQMQVISLIDCEDISYAMDNQRKTDLILHDFHSTMDHIQLNNMLIDNQHGFIPGFSCQIWLISLIEDISYAMDNQHRIRLTDFSKAFDTM